MNWSDEFVDLNKKFHDRKSFDCGKDELNNFIKTQAAKHMEAGISNTLLLPAADPLPSGLFPICSFYAIAPSAIKRETFPQQMAKRLPRYPVPVFLLAQLAVDSQCKGNGLGKITLLKALEHLVEVNERLKAFAIIVDCLDDEARSFYSKYDFEDLCQHNGRTRMFLPMGTAVELFNKKR